MPKRAHHLPKIPYEFLRFIAKVLLTARKTKQMRQNDLAERVGVSRQTIARLEKGDPTIGIGIYLTVAWLLDIPLLGLAEGKESQQAALGQIINFLHQQLPDRIALKREKNIDDKF